MKEKAVRACYLERGECKGMTDVRDGALEAGLCVLTFVRWIVVSGEALSQVILPAVTWAP